MQVEQCGIDKIIPYARNPRKNKEAVPKVKASIKEYGFQQPIVVDKDYVIIVGHTRWEAARQLGMKEVPITIADKLTPQQVKAYRIADNKTAEYAEFDDDLLALEIQELNDAGFDLSLTAFSVPELRDLIFEEFEGLTDPDALPAEILPRAEEGHLYILGQHRLLCGDATKQEHIDLLMNNELGDCIWTDPPYNVDYETVGAHLNKPNSHNLGKIMNDSMDEDIFLQFLTDAFSLLLNYMKPGAPYYVAHANTHIESFTTALKNAGFNVKQQLIWVKHRPALGRQDYNWQHEPLLYGWKPGAAHTWYGEFNKNTVIDDTIDITKLKKEELIEFTQKLLDEIHSSALKFDRQHTNDLHPTMKPTELIKYMLKNSTKLDDIVIDTFGGSGSTLIACEQLQRKCYMMELDPKYVDTIITRWEQFTGDKAIRV